MKIKYIALLLIIVVFFTVGCSRIIRPSEEKVAEGITEKLLTKAFEKIAEDDESEDGSSKVNVDLDSEGGSLVIESDEGNFSIGTGVWPDGGVADSIPKFDKGSIFSMTESEDNVNISFENVNLADFEKYQEDIVAAGYSHNKSTMTTEDLLSYSASSQDEMTYVYLYYMPESETFSISVFIYEE